MLSGLKSGKDISKQSENIKGEIMMKKASHFEDKPKRPDIRLVGVPEGNKGNNKRKIILNK